MLGSQVSVNGVAQELGVNAKVLNRWWREPAKPSTALIGAQVPRDDELSNLERELSRVQKGEELLPDVTALFARDSS